MEQKGNRRLSIPAGHIGRPLPSSSFRSIGGAEISSKHANFFINRHNASAKEFLALMAFARNTVLEKFNIDLEREVKIVGT